MQVFFYVSTIFCITLNTYHKNNKHTPVSTVEFKKYRVNMPPKVPLKLSQFQYYAIGGFAQKLQKWSGAQLIQIEKKYSRAVVVEELAGISPFPSTCFRYEVLFHN